MRVINDVLLVEPIAEEKKTSSGIILLDHDKKPNSAKGIVMGVGNKVEHISHGDIVTYLPHAGKEVEVNGKKHLLLREKSEIRSFEPL